MGMNNQSIWDKVKGDYQSVPLNFIQVKDLEVIWPSYEKTLSAVQDLYRTSSSECLGKIRILEVGAFSGVLSTALRHCGFDVTAWDIPLFMKEQSLHEHYNRAGIHTAMGNLAQLPLEFEDGSFDMIVCSEVLEHLNFNPLPVFCEMNRLLKNGGHFLIGTPNHCNIVKRLLLLNGQSIHNPIQHLVWQLNPSATFSIGLHWREYTASELMQMFSLTGFEVILHRYFRTSDNISKRFPRKQFVSLMYYLIPSFMPCQIAIGRKLRPIGLASLDMSELH